VVLDTSSVLAADDVSVGSGYVTEIMTVVTTAMNRIAVRCHSLLLSYSNYLIIFCLKSQN